MPTPEQFKLYIRIMDEVAVYMDGKPWEGQCANPAKRLFKALVQRNRQEVSLEILEKEIYRNERGDPSANVRNALSKLRECLGLEHLNDNQTLWQDALVRNGKEWIRLEKPGKSSVRLTIPVPDPDIYIDYWDTHDEGEGWVYHNRLMPGFDMGVNTYQGDHNWILLDARTGEVQCAFPAGRAWGIVYVLFGEPSDKAELRQRLDLSAFTHLSFDLKGKQRDSRLAVSIKTAHDLNDGNEPRFIITNLTTDWQNVKIPLAHFIKWPTYVEDRLKNIHIVCALNFEGPTSQSIAFNNIRYTAE